MVANKRSASKVIPIRCEYSGCGKMFTPTTGMGIGRAGRPQRYCPSTTDGGVSACMAKAGQERYWARWRKVVKAAKKAANVNGKAKPHPKPKRKPIAKSVMPKMKHAAILESGAVYMGTLPADTLMGNVTIKAPRMMIGTQAAADAGRKSGGKSLGDRARELKEKFRPKGQ